MQHEHLVIDECGDGQLLESVVEELVDVVVVLARAFPEEAVQRVDRALLVIAAVKEDALWIELLEREDRERHLDAVVAAIDEVAVEEVRACSRREAVRAEDMHQISELPMDVTDDAYAAPCRHIEPDHIRQRLQERRLALEQLGDERARQPLPPAEAAEHVEHDVPRQWQRHLAAVVRGGGRLEALALVLALELPNRQRGEEVGERAHVLVLQPLQTV
mmetsp:Transcript_15047/g.34504  ORF Transcript_15047/g.34504 Transcript_15047/m.34504 type:complete len:218 (-) Transcript_15047:413-1066(-)